MLRFIFWLMLGGILAISIMPAANAPTVFADDKLNHILAFFVLSLMARILWPRINVLILASMLTVFGGAIELLQFSMGLGRQADWMDFAADVFAILLGILFGQMVNGFRNRAAVNE
ncbi:MAG: teicoplanin resistance protein VanZ [Parasphingorhabdus sp.]